MTEYRIGDWTLSVYPGRTGDTHLPDAPPEVVLYKGEYDERKGVVRALDRLTPWSSDFSATLRDAIVSCVDRRDRV